MSPAPSAHIVQLYDSDDFVASAVALFTAEGLRRGEAVLLTGTPEHLKAARSELESQDVDYPAAVRRGQLLPCDAREAAAAMLAQGKPDPERFSAFAAGLLAKARAGGRFAGLRWWGEITSVLHQQGQSEAGLLAEKLADAAVREHGLTVFCSFMCDRFDPEHYPVLHDLCCLHSHVIPARDYVRHRLAVNRAIAETVGEIRGPLLQSLLSWKGPGCDLPSSQALLFWLHDAHPEHFHQVLARARDQHVDA